MKKYLSLLLIIILCFSLASCKTTNNTEATKDEIIETPAHTDNHPAYKKTNYISCYSQILNNAAIAQIEGTVYGTDINGLWKCVDNKEIEHISDKNIQSFVTNGETIIYNCHNEDSENDELWTMDCNGENDTLILEDAYEIKPLMMFSDKIYFEDTFSDYSSYGLCAINTTDGSIEEIESYVDLCTVVDKTIYYMTDDPEDGMYQIKCYNPATERIEKYSSDIDSRAYSLTSYNSGVVANSTHYNEETEEEKTTILYIDLHNKKETKELATVESHISENFKCGDDIYLHDIHSQNNNDKYILTPSDSKVTELKEPDHNVNNIIQTKNSVILNINNEDGCCYLYYDHKDKKLKTIKSFNPKEENILYCLDDVLYYLKDDVIKTEKIKLSDKIAPNILEEEPKKNRPESQDTGYVYTKEEFDAVFYGEFDITGQQSSQKYKTKSRLPQLNIDSEDAKRINKEIIENYGEIFANKEENLYQKIDYVSYLNSNILSLAVGYGKSYQVYNIDIYTGKQLSSEELISKYTDLSFSDAQEQVQKFIKSKYDDVRDDYQDAVMCEERSLEQKNLDKTAFFIDGDKNVVACYYYEWFAGAGGSVQALDTINGRFIY